METKQKLAGVSIPGEEGVTEKDIIDYFKGLNWQEQDELLTKINDEALINKIFETLEEDEEEPCQEQSIELTGDGISRYFEVRYKGKIYYVDYTESDYQNLALCNRDNWVVTDEEGEELQICVSNDSSPEQIRTAEKNAKIFDKLVKFCIKNFDPYIDMLRKDNFGIEKEEV